jgi:DNA polymerase (family 10)
MIRRFIELAALPTENAALLAHQLGVVTLRDLEAALDDGRVGQLLSAPVADRLASTASALRGEAPLLPLDRALDLIDSLLTDLSRVSADITDVRSAGDARRFEPLVRDLVIAAAAGDPRTTIDAICALPAVADVLHQSHRRAILQYQHVEVDVHVAPPAEYGTVLFQATGSREHIKALAAQSGGPSLWAREEDVYRQAGRAWVPAEIRHATGEVEAAARRALPALVERNEIRGDLHMHSTYSGGRDTLAQMVAACSALGYEYIAITDHSEGAAASRTVSIAELHRQRDEIVQLRERFPQIAILHGIEVDILLDGSLDFPDAVLEGLDIVLASMHESGRQDPRTLTRRCIQAIRHPLVNVITHPASRLAGRKAGYALDFDSVYAAAVEAGTALEIDGAPSHLDLDGEHARAAVAAGVTVVVDSDCHRARSLDRQMQMAVGTSGAAGEARHVLNTRSLDEVRAFIAAKRNGPS